MTGPSAAPDRAALAVGILAVFLCVAARFAAADPRLVAAAGSDIVAAFNARAIGSPGLRRLDLQFKSGATVTRRFEVVHLWRQDAAETRSLVFLERPADLRGTSYLWIEGDRTPRGLQVFLRLPAGQRRVLSIAPGRFDEGLLGSDFAYSDLLWQIPTAGRHLQEGGRVDLDGAAARVVESEAAGEAATSSTSWPRIRYYVSLDARALLGADYFDRSARDDPSRQPAKRLRTFGWSDRGGVGVPARMVMTVRADRSSEMHLRQLQLGLHGVDRDLFEPHVLGTLANGFEQGSPHPVFRGGGQ